MSKIKILIVDDEYSFCKAMKALFEKRGYETVFTTNVERALDMIKEERPDVMTLDIRMPGTNGYEVLGKAKYEDIKIIVVSAINIPEMEEKLKHAGAHAVINKPVDLKGLAETINELLK